MINCLSGSDLICYTYFVEDRNLFLSTHWKHSIFLHQNNTKMKSFNRIACQFKSIQTFLSPFRIYGNNFSCFLLNLLQFFWELSIFSLFRSYKEWLYKKRLFFLFRYDVLEPVWSIGNLSTVNDLFIKIFIYFPIWEKILAKKFALQNQFLLNDASFNGDSNKVR